MLTNAVSNYVGENDRNIRSECITNAGVLFRAARYLDIDQLKNLPPGVFRQNTSVKFSNSYITMFFLFLLPDVKRECHHKCKYVVCPVQIIEILNLLHTSPKFYLRPFIYTPGNSKILIKK